MGKNLIGLLALTDLATSADAAGPPLTLAPSSNWLADYGDDYCALRRTFAGEGVEVILELHDTAYGPDFQARVVASNLKARMGTPKTKFEPDGSFGEPRGATRASFTEGRQGILFDTTVFRNGEIDGSDKAKALLLDTAARDKREREITGLSVANGFEQDISLQTGSLHAPMEALRKCLTDLASIEGLDPQKLATLSQSPQPIAQQRWAQKLQENYPGDLVREGKSGILGIRAIVDETGKPIDCKARNNGYDQRFDEVACSVFLKYARFDPALDAERKPVKAYWSTTIIYMVH